MHFVRSNKKLFHVDYYGPSQNHGSGFGSGSLGPGSGCCFDNCAWFAYTPKKRGLRTNPKPKPWFRKGPLFTMLIKQQRNRFLLFCQKFTLVFQTANEHIEVLLETNQNT